MSSAKKSPKVKKTSAKKPTRSKKSRAKKSNANAFDADLFLRSINLAFDADHPNRISHFRPTTKCTALMRALLGLEDDRAFFLVAPYGSGKSITSSYVLHLIENSKDSAAVRRTINKRLEIVSPELAKTAASRAASKTKRGIAITLHGHTPKLTDQIKDAAIASMKRAGLGRNTRAIRTIDETDPAKVLKAITTVCAKAGCDKIAIIWDEFGRHLESIVADGRGDELADIQSLAEYASRSQKVGVTLCLILHQGLLNYASGIPQTMRADWKKIEGRFRTIEYVDDSKEVYRLISEVVASQRGSEPSASDVRGSAKKCVELGILTEFKSRELGELIKSSYPLEPSVLYLLPRISARVAQNERTLFSFLYEFDFSEPISPEALYDYFAPAMRSDTAVGGTHRQWLETESAISKLPNDHEGIAILKAACLLGFGTSGERARADRPLLEFAAKGYRAKAIRKPLKDLLDRKLLLHRKHNDDISVWHGTDVDLRGRLDDERARVSVDFDLVEFLTKEAPPPVWKPTLYNDDMCIRRYLTGEYMSPSGFGAFVNFELVVNASAAEHDGQIAYLVTNDGDALKQATIAAADSSTDPQLVVAVPREPIPLFEAAIEVAALQRMQLDRELLDSDPLALAELQQMTDDAFGHLQRLVDRLVVPGPDGPRWFHRGKEITANTAAQLRCALSDIMHEVFPLTPRLNSETVNRKKPSGTLVNSRKKLVMAILERHGDEALGIEGYFPDRAMFNTLLLHTGLYRFDNKTKTWGYAHSRSIKNNPGLKKVWARLQQFLTAPAERPKQFAPFLEELKSPPFGVRDGVLPVLVAAALRAFPSAISLLHRGEYVTDILPSTLEELCKNPDRFELFVLDIDAKKQKFLRACHKYFSHAANYEIEENDLVRLTYDALEAWKHQLPPAALTTRRISDSAAKFRTAVFRTKDPIQLFFQAIPNALGCDANKPTVLMKAMKQSCEELQNVATIYYEGAQNAVRESVSSCGGDGALDLRKLAKKWAGHFPQKFIDNLSDGTAKGFISRMSLEYDSDQLLVDSLASLLVNKSIRRWDDTVGSIFDREVNNMVLKIENSALGSARPSKALKAGMSDLLIGRIEELYGQLVELVGPKPAAESLEVLSTKQEGVKNGNDARRTRKPVRR